MINFILNTINGIVFIVMALTCCMLDSEIYWTQIISVFFLCILWFVVYTVVKEICCRKRGY